MRLKKLEKATIDKLKSINWDFGNRKIVDKETIFPFNNRKYHTYPATYIPEIPFTLIEILSNEGDLVLDPFGGIGTTLVQALIQGREAISVDNNPIASKVTQDFFVLFNPAVDIEKCSDCIECKLKEYVAGENYSSLLENQRKLFEGWYEESTFDELAFLIIKYDQIKKEKDEAVEALFHLCLSNILTTVSSQNGGWAYIADNVKPKEKELVNKHAIDRFYTNLVLCVKGIQEHKMLILDKSSVRRVYTKGEVSNVINSDLIQADLETIKEKVNLVITSPPYPRMIDYVKSQRLSFYLEDIGFEHPLQQEIGARYRRNIKGTTEKYIEDMKKCNKKIYDCLCKGGYLCYILPEFPKETDRREAIEEVINDCYRRGFEEVFRADRCIPGTQRSNNIKWASLKKEQIIVLEKCR